MKISVPDYLVLHSSGIDTFLQLVEQRFTGDPSNPSYEQCAKDLFQRIKEYGANRDAFATAPVAAPIPAPLTMALARLLDRRTCNNREYCALKSNVVYVIRDGETALYVGSTRYDARSRIKSHQKAHSPLGQALRTQKIDEWAVEMIAHAEYREAAEKEKRLIAELRPRFNLKY